MRAHAAALLLCLSCGGGADFEALEWKVRRGELVEAREVLLALEPASRGPRGDQLLKRVEALLAEEASTRAALDALEAKREELSLEEVLQRLEGLAEGLTGTNSKELVARARSAAADWDAERRARGGFRKVDRSGQGAPLDSEPAAPSDALVALLVREVEAPSAEGQHRQALAVAVAHINASPGVAELEQAFLSARERALLESQTLIQRARQLARDKGRATASAWLDDQRERFPDEVLQAWDALDLESAVASGPAAEELPTLAGPDPDGPVGEDDPASVSSASAPAEPEVPARPTYRLSTEELVLDAAELFIRGERARLDGRYAEAWALLDTAAGRTSGPERERCRRRADEAWWADSLQIEWPESGSDLNSTAAVSEVLASDSLGPDALAGLAHALVLQDEKWSRSKALEALALVPDLETGHRDELVALALEVDIPDGGFVLHEGRFLSALEHDRTLVGKEVEGLVRDLLGKRPERRDEALASLSDLAIEHPWAGRELTRSFEELTSRALKGLERSKVAGALADLRAAREELDGRRRHALELIFDEVRYFYPVAANRRAEYELVQREVDERVDHVRDLWERNPSVRFDERLVTSVRDLLWVQKARGLRSLPEPCPAWMAYLDLEGGEVSLQTLVLDRKEWTALRRSAQVAELNQERWAAAEGLAAGEAKQVQITNAYRAMLGRTRLSWDARLQDAARVHSEYMSRTGNFGHFEEDVPERRTPFDRMREQGYARGVSENCHMGSGDPLGAHNGWTHSSGHHRNLLMSGHREMATAVAAYYWTQNFGVDSSAQDALPALPPDPWQD